ncbi:hypothetical protein SAMN05444000_13815 [Shimia gijangensis]|uniref:GIY-YIG domain-containing protein n=2 Tax=Shimia gijangensis TaxID=1470563 RepID=A0A1M6TDZ2_9RHOB|nr:hypothetical protein SAMN05444000_13815 [Shimia gijangensis]
MPTADIARYLNLRYQHVYNVLAQEKMLPSKMKKYPILTEKPSLSSAQLVSRGFLPVAKWVKRDEMEIQSSVRLPPKPAVYAFAVDGQVQYVGVATKSVAQRLGHYSRPGPSQKTNQRINALIKQLLMDGKSVEILLAHPPDLDWNGFPVDGCSGLELGIIKKFELNWNIRSSN